MSGNGYSQRIFLTRHALAASVFLLAACNEGGGLFGGEEEAGAGTDAALTLGGDTVSRDVEAPEVFSVNEAGLWDGRPSLGGVWVAHPDVTDPERVIIRNEANGNFVIGALFRRERENPGPALQVSSDAAEELGVLAGAPTVLNVVALRREDGPAEAGVAVSAFDEAPEVEVASLDPVAEIATGAIAAAEAAPAPEPAPAVAPQPVAAPASTLDKPFVQIGIFSIEANATDTADRLRGAGLSARVLSQQSNGRPFWRVIVGPAPTAADRDAVLAQVKGLGFTDAYFVTN